MCLQVSPRYCWPLKLTFFLAYKVPIEKFCYILAFLYLLWPPLLPFLVVLLGEDLNSHVYSADVLAGEKVAFCLILDERRIIYFS